MDANRQVNIDIFKMSDKELNIQLKCGANTQKMVENFQPSELKTFIIITETQFYTDKHVCQFVVNMVIYHY